jgi:hypothetical protein
MGRKSASKGQAPTQPPRTGRQAKRVNPLIIAALVAAVAVVGMLALWRQGAPGTAGTADPSGEKPAAASQPTPEIIAKTEAAAKTGPRSHMKLPPIPFQTGYAPPRPAEIITAAYRFAADHPEILGYVPCFCGCENSGHSGNADCFVKSRTAEGDVLAWDEHGVECTVCIDVANRSRQLFTSGASVTDIRTAIEKEFGAMYPGRTPTPAAPGHASHTN